MINASLESTFSLIDEAIECLITCKLIISDLIEENTFLRENATHYDNKQN